MYKQPLTERQQELIREMKIKNPNIEDRTQIPKMLRPSIEGETEAQYIERLTAEYKSKINDKTPPALVDRAIGFIQAMASKVFELPASEELQAERLATCFACVHFLVAMEEPEQVGHCAACGCSQNKLSSLSTKSKIRKSTCPKNLWDVAIDPDAVPLPVVPPAT